MEQALESVSSANLDSNSKNFGNVMPDFQTADKPKVRASVVEFPACGMFIGCGVYPTSEGYLLCTLYGHQSWIPQTFSPLELIDKVIDDNQGNLVQLWGYSRGYSPATIATWQYALDELGVDVPEPDFENGTNIRAKESPQIAAHPERYGAGILRFAKTAASKGLYTTCIYTDALPQWSTQLHELGKHYLGYDFGERFTFRLDDAALMGKRLEDVTLQVLADDFINRVKEHVDERRAAGWGQIMATSCNFYIDYEVLGGVDVPLLEDFAFTHLNIASALSRGLCGQHELPYWGTHMAHEHYSWIPYSNPRKFDLLHAAMYLKYMSGAKMIINESGNWFVEACLCPDSPKHELPIVPLKHDEVDWNGTRPIRFLPYIDEARKHFHKLDYNSPTCRRYRKEMSDFYDYVKAHGTPSGQPETTVAIAKGHLDLSHERFNPNSAVAGAFALADRNPAWFCGPPERGWETVVDTFFPLRPVLGDHPNLCLSGTPLGMVDIVSFANNRITASHLNSAYQALLFAGWNSSSAQQYDILLEYVRNGGTLFISIPHLSTNITRNYTSYTTDELVHGGDFSELCGVRVVGRGKRFYWATATRESDELGIRFPQRFGPMETSLGELEIVDPNMETLLVEDERARPILMRRRCGKGVVYFLNSWAYPGALRNNIGPGAEVDSPGLIGEIYRHIAQRHRGTVWITDDRHQAGPQCDYINVSYFPEDGSVFLFNIDYVHPHQCYLHHGADSVAVELAPGEFRRMPVIDGHASGAK